MNFLKDMMAYATSKDDVHSTLSNSQFAGNKKNATEKDANLTLHDSKINSNTYYHSVAQNANATVKTSLNPSYAAPSQFENQYPYVPYYDTQSHPYTRSNSQSHSYPLKHILQKVKHEKRSQNPFPTAMVPTPLYPYQVKENHQATTPIHPIPSTSLNPPTASTLTVPIQQSHSHAVSPSIPSGQAPYNPRTWKSNTLNIRPSNMNKSDYNQNPLLQFYEAKSSNYDNSQLPPLKTENYSTSCLSKPAVYPGSSNTLPYQLDEKKMKHDTHSNMSARYPFSSQTPKTSYPYNYGKSRSATPTSRPCTPMRHPNFLPRAARSNSISSLPTYYKVPKCERVRRFAARASERELLVDYPPNSFYHQRRQSITNQALQQSYGLQRSLTSRTQASSTKSLPVLPKKEMANLRFQNASTVKPFHSATARSQSSHPYDKLFPYGQQYIPQVFKNKMNTVPKPILTADRSKNIAMIREDISKLSSRNSFFLTQRPVHKAYPSTNPASNSNIRPTSKNLLMTTPKVPMPYHVMPYKSRSQDSINKLSTKTTTAPKQYASSKNINLLPKPQSFQYPNTFLLDSNRFAAEDEYDSDSSQQFTSPRTFEFDKPMTDQVQKSDKFLTNSNAKIGLHKNIKSFPINSQNVRSTLSDSQAISASTAFRNHLKAAKEQSLSKYPPITEMSIQQHTQAPQNNSSWSRRGVNTAEIYKNHHSSLKSSLYDPSHVTNLIPTASRQDGFDVDDASFSSARNSAETFSGLQAHDEISHLFPSNTNLGRTAAFQNENSQKNSNAPSGFQANHLMQKNPLMSKNITHWGTVSQSGDVAWKSDNSASAYDPASFGHVPSYTSINVPEIRSQASIGHFNYFTSEHQNPAQSESKPRNSFTEWMASSEQKFLEENKFYYPGSNDLR